MKLRRIAVRRLAGLDPFVLDVGEGGLVVVHGPNGSGKTSLAAVVRGTLWPDTEPRLARAEADTTWTDAAGRTRVARLEDGEVAWQDGAAPALPDAHLADCFLMRLGELLDRDGAGEDDLARAIAAAFSGGHDLAALADRLFPEPTPHAKGSARRRLDEARRVLNDCVRRAQDNAVVEAELDALRARVEDAKVAHLELSPLTDALELARLHRTRVELNAAAAQLPTIVKTLSGNEREHRARMVGVIFTAATARRDAEAQLERIDEDIERARFGAEPLAEEVLGAWLERARALEKTEEQLAAAERVAAACSTEVDAARATLHGAGDEALVALDDATLQDIAALLVDAAAWRERKASLDVVAVAADDGADPERLAAAARSLAAWLASPAEIVPGLEPRMAQMLTFAAIAAGVALGALVHPWLSLVAAVGILAVLLLVLRARTPHWPARAGAAQDFMATGVAPPNAWTDSAVRARLAVLESELAHARATEHTRMQAMKDEAGVSARDAALSARRRALSARLGLPEETFELRLYEFAQGLTAWQRAVERRHAAMELAVSLRRACDEQSSAAGEFLTACGFSTPADGAAAVASIERLRDRNARWSVALAQRTHAEQVVARERQAERDAAARLEDFDARLGLDEIVRLDEHYARLGPEVGKVLALEHALVAKPAWDDLTKRRFGIEVQIAALEARLAERPELVVRHETAIEADLLAARERADGLAASSKRLGEIENALDQARRSHEMQEAAEAVQAAEDEIAAQRAATLRAAAGRFLLERVRREHETVGRPAVLRRASALFESFTAHAYTLDVVHGDEPEFAAVERATGLRRSLDELSDGTRLQLLLAGRLGFALEAEQGAGIPLILDEALANSDPERTRAVVQALLALTADGARQVFYLTSNPADVALLRSLCREAGRPDPVSIDLAEVRRIGAAGVVPADYALGRTDLPDPAGLAPDEYAVRLRVPQVPDGAPVDGWHPFHVFRDDLPQLAGLLRATGAESLGQLAAAVDDSALSSAIDARTRAAVHVRLAVARATIAAWRIGRGRTLGAEDLVRCEAVTDSFRERLLELREEVDGRAPALLAALEQKRVKNFRAEKLEELRAYLENEGFVDARERLDRVAIGSAALGAVQSRLAEAALSVEDVQALVSDVLAAIESAAARAVHGRGAAEAGA